jgi:type IV pilus assembly protein PilA
VILFQLNQEEPMKRQYGSALPAYQDYTIRARVSEGLVLAGDAKLAEGGVASVSDLATTAAAWNAQAGGKGITSKYVDGVQINPANGTITVTYVAGNVGVGAAANTLTLTPWIRDTPPGQQLATALAAGATGSTDWGCSSTTSVKALADGITPTAAGTLLAKYAPANCR